MQNSKNNSQPNLLGRIYKSPGDKSQQQQQKALVPNIGKNKKLDPLPEAGQKKIIHVGHYPLGIIKEHNVAAVFINDKANNNVMSPTLAKSIQAKNVALNMNPNAASPSNETKKKGDELSLGEKKTLIQGIRGTKGEKHGHEKTIKDEYLSPFDFIALLRTDPDMADEFCYLNKRENSYDWMIVDFEKRNIKEYMTISSRVSIIIKFVLSAFRESHIFWMTKPHS